MNPSGRTKRENLRSRTGKGVEYTAAGALAIIPWIVGLSAHEAEAVPAIWNVFPGINVSGLYDYGWHFNETAGDQFGARDYNRNPDNGLQAAYWAQMSGVGSTYPIRFKLEYHGACGVKVNPQFFDGASVWNISGAEFHYLHLRDRPASPSYTDWHTEYGSTFLHSVGYLDTCATTATHLHQSADLEQNGQDAYVNRVGMSGDTCWSDVDTFHCPSTYRTHETCSSWDGMGGISGNIAQYVCETWSAESRNPKSAAFQVTW